MRYTIIIKNSSIKPTALANSVGFNFTQIIC
jgi:hypothetical protein